VQKVRDAAARTQCLNNCHQMGLAMHNYQSSRAGRLPNFVSTAPQSPFLAMLQYIEKDDVLAAYKAGNNVVLNSTTTVPAAAIPIPTYGCPADRTYNQGQSANAPVIGTSTVRYATCSYAANYRIFGSSAANLNTSFAHGLTGTIMLADKYAECSRNKTNPPTSATIAAQIWAWDPATWYNATTQVYNLDYAPTFGFISPEGAGGTQTGYTPLSGTVFQDKPAAPSVGVTATGQVSDCGLASSPHTGGLVVALADGSSRVIAPEVDKIIWEYLVNASSPQGPQGEY